MLVVLSLAWAVQPDEVLDDPILEERARELSKGLRCLVCRNESIDESNADLARDLRLLVRERLIAGETNDEVLDFVVDRYGEYVLLKPEFTGSNWLLYAAGPLIFLISLALGTRYVRARQSAVPDQEIALSEEENARLNVILKK
ncbi:MAG: cytochrome c-type biogenesis protein CcmH [Aestuariivita sp.]|nr:cytochrome c-type biogenesis protein CcmH [Aestuariivita sp.]